MAIPLNIQSFLAEKRSFVPVYRRFYNLCRYRVQQILLIASDYDAFSIAEDGQLGARLFYASSEFYQLSMPRFLHASSAEEALALLEGNRVDLVLSSFTPFSLEGRHLQQQLNERYASVPVVLLILDEVYWRQQARQELPEGIDWAFFWTGDQRLVMAILRLVEDAFNVSEDTKNVGVQVILAVEDSISSYSLILSYLYEELMEQSRSLVAEGVNLGHRALRMLTRPKILLARNFKQALDLFERYESHVMALITDVRFALEPGEGATVSESAGFRLAKICTERKPGLPVLMHSSDCAARRSAEELGYHFALKNSEQLHSAISNFFSESLGFGEFVFRLPNRVEVGRAKDTYEFVRLLQSVDLASLTYHANFNHFSVWLRARSLFDLADAVLKLRLEDFASPEELRQVLVQMLQEYTSAAAAGLIADLHSSSAASQGQFLKIGGGSMGGKGRGIAFLHSRLLQLQEQAGKPGLALAVPRTVVLGTEVYDKFLRYNGLDVGELVELSDAEIWQRLQGCQLPPEVLEDLSAALSAWQGPLIVRSSSLLEDSQHQSCAGLYHTCVVRCDQADKRCRLEDVARAIFRVYMSTFAQKARTYFANTLFSAEEEKMAVVIQELVGEAHGDLFYPLCAGVGVSYNYYPLGPQRKEDGVVAMCLGLGNGVVEGGRCVRFSPRWPRILPHLLNSNSFLKYAQRSFYALDLGQRGNDEGLTLQKLSRAESDGTLALVASVLTEGGSWRDGLCYEGVRAVTFSDMLQNGELPLAAVLYDLAQAFERALDGVAEFEFAVALEPQPTLHLLQLRPLMRGSGVCETCHDEVKESKAICVSSSTLGHGRYLNIRDIVWVHRDNLDARQAHQAAREVAKFNAKLLDWGHPYVLIGPGRWGTSDASLGIPVTIGQIMGVKVIVELPYGGRSVEPSQGSHFFHELSSLDIGYITVSEHAHFRREKADSQYDRENDEQGFFDSGWLERRSVCEQGELVRHIALERPLRIDLGCADLPATIAH